MCRKTGLLSQTVPPDRDRRSGQTVWHGNPVLRRSDVGRACALAKLLEDMPASRLAGTAKQQSQLPVFPTQRRGVFPRLIENSLSDFAILRTKNRIYYIRASLRRTIPPTCTPLRPRHKHMHPAHARHIISPDIMKAQRPILRQLDQQPLRIQRPRMQTREVLRGKVPKPMVHAPRRDV